MTLHEPGTEEQVREARARLASFADLNPDGIAALEALIDAKIARDREQLTGVWEARVAGLERLLKLWENPIVKAESPGNAGVSDANEVS